MLDRFGNRRAIRTVARSLALFSALVLLACAGTSRTPISGRGGPAAVVAEGAGTVFADDAWVVLVPFDAGGREIVADSVRTLVETRLRARGVSGIVPGPRATGDGPLVRTAPSVVRDASGDFTAALERARLAGRRYAVAVTLEEWSDGRLPGDRARVAVDIGVHDLHDDRVVLQERASRTARGGAGMTATADRAIAAALDPLVVTSRVGGAAAPSHADDASPGLPGSSGTGWPRGTIAALESSAGEISLATAGAGRSPGLDTASLGLRAAGAPPRTDAATAAALDGRATAFFYGRDLPIAALAQFDRVILEPDNATPAELGELAARSAATFAYLSVGEVGPGRAWRDRIDDAWVIGRNDAWDSEVMDLASGWTTFLDERVDELVARGYAGLFLDTMDSHVAHAATPDARARQARGLAEFIGRARERHPALRLIANRGFEVLDAVGPELEAIAAESLYARWDNAAGRYSAVPENDRAWLLGQLEAARDRHGVDVISIDYVPVDRRDAARAVAARIAAHDFVPWVATPELDHIGVGAIDVVPREVLMLHDSRVDARQANTEVHRLLATPLEYLGLVPVYHDIAAQGLPSANLGGRYAGVAYWARGTGVPMELRAWFEAQADAGVPLALFGAPWIAPGSALAGHAGLAIDAVLDADSARARTSDALIGFEKPLPRRLGDLGRQARSVATTNTVHLGLEDGAGREADLVVTGPWGGYAAQPGAIENDLDDLVHWIVDPYAFFRRAFRLPDAPMPDVTSEAGKRLWLAHIDGDALPSWSELPGRRLGAEVIRERILDRYPLPHTISVVEAEMTRFPAYADRRARMYAVMREIFARPDVEIASHTFSHPFRWRELAEYRASGKHNLAVGPYDYSPVREIAGSAAFIDRVLAPPGKRTEVLLWSGDALPNEADLAAADDAGLVNMNGGSTTINRAEPLMSLVTPMARTVGERLQVYAPIMNENVYTNDWLGPFDGFRRVIETFEMTERPRRLKPLNIYYHFYIGTKAAGIRSLEEVYEWSLEQDIHPVTAGDYSRRVRVFREAGLARRLDGSWRLDGMDGLRSVRIVGDRTRLDPAGSEGVASHRGLHDGLYLGTDGRGRVRIALDPVAGRSGAVTTLSSVDEP